MTYAPHVGGMAAALLPRAAVICASELVQGECDTLRSLRNCSSFLTYVRRMSVCRSLSCTSSRIRCDTFNSNGSSWQGGRRGLSAELPAQGRVIEYEAYAHSMSRCPEVQPGLLTAGPCVCTHLQPAQNYAGCAEGNGPNRSRQLGVQPNAVPHRLAQRFTTLLRNPATSAASSQHGTAGVHARDMIKREYRQKNKTRIE